MLNSVRCGWCFLAVLCSVSLLAAPGEARQFSLAAATVRITASELSPSILRLTASMAAPSWENDDTVEHTVRFQNGLCTVTVAPGERKTCTDAFWRYVGIYPYTLDASADAAGRLVVVPALRRLTISASRKTITPGERVVLGGTLFYQASRPPFSGQPITVMRRANGKRNFVKIAEVHSTLAAATTMRTGTFEWRLVLHPAQNATYRAQDLVEPAAGKIWQPAVSSSVTIRARP